MGRGCVLLLDKDHTYGLSGRHSAHTVAVDQTIIDLLTNTMTTKTRRRRRDRSPTPEEEEEEEDELAVSEDDGGKCLVGGWVANRHGQLLSSFVAAGTTKSVVFCLDVFGQFGTGLVPTTAGGVVRPHVSY